MFARLPRVRCFSSSSSSSSPSSAPKPSSTEADFARLREIGEKGTAPKQPQQKQVCRCFLPSWSILGIPTDLTSNRLLTLPFQSDEETFGTYVESLRKLNRPVADTSTKSQSQRLREQHSQLTLGKWEKMAFYITSAGLLAFVLLREKMSESANPFAITSGTSGSAGGSSNGSGESQGAAVAKREEQVIWDKVKESSLFSPAGTYVRVDSTIPLQSPENLK